MTTTALPTPSAHPVSNPGADVIVVDTPETSVWEEYLDKHGSRSLYHRSAWDLVFETYGLSILRLAAMRQGRITGVLPLVHQRSRVFGDRLVSLPWFDATGILADDEADTQALVRAAVRRAESRCIRSVEVRQAEPMALSPHVRTDKVLMRLSLESDPQFLWDRLKAKVRNQIRKGEKASLEYVVGGAELLPEFFRVYASNMRDLGSPSHSLRFFAETLRSFPESACLHVVRRQGRAVGAGLTLACGDTMEIPWASSLRKYNGLCVNHVLYWRILQRACCEGRAWFHFGRSTRDSGTYHFKRQWGAEEVPLYWYHLGRDAADEVAQPTRKSFGWAAEVWRHLPYCIAHRLGPHVISKVS